MIKKIINLKILICCFILIFVLGITAGAESSIKENLTDSFPYTYAEEKNEKTKIYPTEKNGEIVFILPSSADAENVILFKEKNEKIGTIKGSEKEGEIYSGKAFNLNEYCSDENYCVTLIIKNKEYKVRFMFSENVPALFIISENPENNGREWVESSIDKSNKAKGEIVIQNTDGKVSYEGILTQIKGRGNSTWDEVKKPYQIKTAEKTDLLNTGKSENMSSTWVLLANYLDSSVMNNYYAMRIGQELGLGKNIENKHVDLYYDGEYRGSYLLSEKVEVGKGRVNVADMDEKNKEANGETIIEEMPISNAVTSNGAFFTYCEGAASPEDISGGYLLEMDYEVRALEEISYFRTTRGQHVVVKSPEYATKEEMEYIASLYQEYEDAVYNGGVNPSTGKSYSDYVDKESIAIYYMMHELTKSRDFFSSSAYLYKEAGEDKMYMGPLWDYDLGFGRSRYERKEEEPVKGENIYNTMFGRKLLQIKDFADILNEKYEKELYPLIKNIIMGEENAVSESGLIHSFIYEKNRLYKTSECNNFLWYDDKNYEEDVDMFYNFISQRAEFLKDAFKSYTQREPGREDLFGDVPKEAWFFDAVMDVKVKGYMSNVYNTFFDPYSKVKRVEAAQVVFRISGAEEPMFEKIYSDINEKDYYSPLPIIWASKNDVIKGYPDGTFRPYGFVSREEMATILYRFAKEPPVEGEIPDTFADKNEVSGFAKKAVSWAIENGYLYGDTQRRINPRGTITRAELATIVSRYTCME